MAIQTLAARIAMCGLTATGLLAQSDSSFKFSGFGTLAATRSSEKNAAFVAG
jgi:hypothetical protein